MPEFLPPARRVLWPAERVYCSLPRRGYPQARREFCPQRRKIESRTIKYGATVSDRYRSVTRTSDPRAGGPPWGSALLAKTAPRRRCRTFVGLTNSPLLASNSRLFARRASEGVARRVRGGARSGLGKVNGHQTYLPAVRRQAQACARLSRTDEHTKRACGHQCPACQRPQTARRLSRRCALPVAGASASACCARHSLPPIRPRLHLGAHHAAGSP